MSDKTEQPTPRRLAKARSEGDSPISVALSQSVGFLAALSLVNGAVALASERAATLVSRALTQPTQPASPGALVSIVLSVTVPMVAASAVASAAVSFAQTGGTLSLKKLSPSLDRLNVVTGLKGLFSWQRLVGLARALVAAALVGWYAVRRLSEHGADFYALTGATLGALKTASVVIVNPTHLATALKYSEEDDAAPSVVAQGQGEMAKLIIDAARAYGVPVVRDVPVARALNDLELGDEIPEALYEAVAEILREIWQG